MKRTSLAVALLAAAAAAAPRARAERAVHSRSLSYRVGPYAAGGRGFFGGAIDYFSLRQRRDGGINGVKLTWEECETEYNAARGVECYERLKNKGPAARPPSSRCRPASPTA